MFWQKPVFKYRKIIGRYWFNILEWRSLLETYPSSSTEAASADRLHRGRAVFLCLNNFRLPHPDIISITCLKRRRTPSGMAAESGSPENHGRLRGFFLHQIMLQRRALMQITHSIGNQRWEWVPFGIFRERKNWGMCFPEIKILRRLSKRVAIIWTGI